MLYYATGWLESRGCGEAFHFVGPKERTEAYIANTYSKSTDRTKYIDCGTLIEISKEEASQLEDGVLYGIANDEYFFWGGWGPYADFEEVFDSEGPSEEFLFFRKEQKNLVNRIEG